MTCPATRATRDRPRRALEAIVAGPSYPCLGARSVLAQDGAEFAVFPELGAPDVAPALLDRLNAFAAAAGGGARFASFVATFRGPEIESEEHFESLLWRQLQALHDADPAPWCDGVADDPVDANFALSLGGVAYFVIGLHPKASRLARRVPFPALVFNPHAQFEALRAAGAYERLRDAIRRRDLALQGTPNPMACDHGESSPARQYSGRAVGDAWRAPFAVRVKR